MTPLIRPTDPMEGEYRWPLAFKLAIGLGLIVWAFAFLGVRSLFSQVPPSIDLRNGTITSTIIRNSSAHETLKVTVELRYRHVAGTTVTTGREIKALVSPTLFTLKPGETQTVRIRLRETIVPGQILALVTTMTPTLADEPAPGSDKKPVARLILATRIVSKARVVP